MDRLFEDFKYEWRKILDATAGLETAIYKMLEENNHNSFEQGYDEGHEEGFQDGEQYGFDRGRDDGYAEGYEDGLADAKEGK
jgi:flagellar biosynthesis/type III secretory pathway protein FliH